MPIFGCFFILFQFFISILILVFSFVHISDRFACYSRDYHHSFFLLVFWFLLLPKSYIHIWIALLSWFYLVLVSILQELQGEMRAVSLWGYIKSVWTKNEQRATWGYIFTTYQFLQVTIVSNQNNTQPPPEGDLKFQMQAIMQMVEMMNFVMGNICDRLYRVKRLVQAPKMWVRLGLNQKKIGAIGAKGQGRLIGGDSI